LVVWFGFSCKQTRDPKKIKGLCVIIKTKRNVPRGIKRNFLLLIIVFISVIILVCIAFWQILIPF